jgi:hypothetical protein
MVPARSGTRDDPFERIEKPGLGAVSRQGFHGLGHRKRFRAIRVNGTAVQEEEEEEEEETRVLQSVHRYTFQCLRAQYAVPGTLRTNSQGFRV